MTEHTPEPWDVVHIATKAGPALLRIQARYGNRSMDDSQLAPVIALGEGVNKEANARRIRACVNACMGIPIEALEAVEVPTRTKKEAKP